MRKARRSDIRSSRLPSPLHLGPSFATYRHLDVREKLRISRALPSIARMGSGDAHESADQTFAQWLRQRGQSEVGIRAFWDLMLVAALNCRCEEASVGAALFVLRQGFLKSSTSAALGIPAVGLTELHVQPAIRYIESRGGEVRLRSEVRALRCGEGVSSQSSLPAANGRPSMATSAPSRIRTWSRCSPMVLAN